LGHQGRQATLAGTTTLASSSLAPARQGHGCWPRSSSSSAPAR
jgi:hypothetical protein